MGTKNKKGQALLEMALVMSMFLLFWIFLLKSVESQKKSTKKWKLGHDAKIELKKSNEK